MIYRARTPGRHRTLYGRGIEQGMKQQGMEQVIQRHESGFDAALPERQGSGARWQ
jgi:hypothetical protein